MIGVVERLRLAPDLQDGVLFVGPRAVAIDPDADGYSTVLNAYSRNGFEQIPFVAAPRVATSSKAMLLPAVRINTSAADFFPIEQMQLGRFDGEHWVLFGGVFDASRK